MAGGKGARFPSEHSVHRDPATGATVHQMTSHASINHATYFLQSAFTPEGRSLLITSYRGGCAQLYEIDGFPEGEIRQLTDGAAIHPFSPAIHPGGQTVFFVRGGSLWKMDRQSLAEECIVNFGDAQLGECSLGADGEWLTAAARRGAEQGIVAGRTDGSGWRFIAFSRTVIHPQFHPLEPDWIEFAADPAPRIHRVKRDGTWMECLYEHDNDEFVVHETFLGRTGDIVYTVWPRCLMRMSWQNRRRSVIAEFNAWHITPNRAGTAVLCDTNHPDRGLHFIDVATGRPSQLCLSQSSNGGSQWKKSRYALAEDFAVARSEADKKALSWMEVSTDTVYGPQWTHPHPSLSPDESKVVFASDRSGHTQVYVVELPVPG